jgi:hypothetical protein
MLFASVAQDVKKISPMEVLRMLAIFFLAPSIMALDVRP